MNKILSILSHTLFLKCTKCPIQVSFLRLDSILFYNCLNLKFLLFCEKEYIYGQKHQYFVFVVNLLTSSKH